MRKFLLVLSLSCFVWVSSLTVSFAQDISIVDSVNDNKGIVVQIEGENLFKLYDAVTPFSVEDRVNLVEEKLQSIIQTPNFDSSLIKVQVNTEEGIAHVFYDSKRIVSLTQAESEREGKDLAEFAQEKADFLEKYIKEKKNLTLLKDRAIEIALSIAAFVLLYFIYFFAQKIFARLENKIQLIDPSQHKAFKIGQYKLVSQEDTSKFLLYILRGVKYFLYMIVLYLFIPVLFSIFPESKDLAATLLSYIVDPLSSIASKIFAYIPNLLTIGVIYFITLYAIKFVHFISKEVERGAIKFEGFYPEWALPTYTIVKFFLYMFMAISIFPYLPGSDSPVFQGFSVFLGVLLSFGSSSAISNILAGLVITYMRPFKIGDRVTIDDVTGIITEKTLLVTRVRTPKNEDVTIPNAKVMSDHTINYSSLAATKGLILYTSITIGYDVSWKKVYELMIAAAEKTNLVLENPKPFVYQTKLDDFYVEYELNVFIEDATKIPLIKSLLHQNIQTAFHEANVEIMSPHYRAERDGSAIAIPEKEEKVIDVLEVREEQAAEKNHDKSAS